MPDPERAGRSRDDQEGVAQAANDVRPAREGVLRKAMGEWHPAAVAAAVALVSYAAITSVLIVAGLLVTHHGVSHWDDHVGSWFVRHRSSPWNRWTADATVLANTLGIAVVGAVVTVFLLVRRWGSQAFLIPLGLCIELASFLTVNYTVRRPRPSVRHLGSTPSTYSWPSGHVAATFVLYGAIAVLITARCHRLAPKLLAWCIVAGLTVAVALSRIYRGEHHATDTMAGVVLGIAALTAATFALTLSDRAARSHAVGRRAAGRGFSGTAPGDQLPRRATVG